MDVDAFISLGDNIEGESIQKGYEGQLDVLSWSWGMSQSGTTHIGKGSGGGKVSVQDLSITHYVDKSSPKIIGACCSGEPIGEAILTLRKAGGKEQLPYLIITLNQAIITSVQTGGGGDGVRITENFTLNFAYFKYAYQMQKEDGSKEGGEVIYEANIAEGVFS